PPQLQLNRTICPPYHNTTNCAHSSNGQPANEGGPSRTRAFHPVSATQHRFGRNFEVLDSAGRSLFQASQDYQFCCPTYHVKITDNSQREVLTLQQQRACCISREIEVISLGGIFLGRIKLHLNAFVTHLSVISPENIVLLQVIGPGFQTNVFGNSSFEVKSPDEQHVVGMFRYENSQFILSFPLDLDVGVKALLLGGCMFLDTLLYGARARMMRQRRRN
uniref:Phospholipid scramblase n=1 Tax=Leptobrachium leishanense TaxID=445787 RepID=A0A8C5LY78_9ANUR